MSEPISRRRFLRDSALVSGAIALAEPTVLWSTSGVGAASGAPQGERLSDGVFAQVEQGGADAEFVKRWTRLGGDLALDLQPAGLLLHVPTRSVQEAERLTFEEFEEGQGHHEIAQHFGPPALAELRTEVAYLRMFPSRISA